jgi:hypothetical protein
LPENLFEFCSKIGQKIIRECCEFFKNGQEFLERKENAEFDQETVGEFDKVMFGVISELF